MKRTITLLLVLVLGLSFFGCAAKEEPNIDSDGNIVTDQAKILEISVWNSGMGLKWLEDLKAEFLKRNKGVAVSIKPTANMSTFYNTISSGARANSIDLYLNYAMKYRKYFEGEFKNANLIEPLTEVLSHRAEGESKTIGEKFGPVLDDFWYEDVCYALPYANIVSGIVYNEGLFERYGWKVPRTTQELRNLALQIIETEEFSGAGKTPFAHYPSYWQTIAAIWWAQYEGIDRYFDYWELENIDPHNLSQESYQQPGLRKALQALYDCIAQEGATLPGSNSQDHTLIQTKFLNDQAAAMYPSGSWLETEAEKGGSYHAGDVKINAMKTPILSEIVEKMSPGTSESDLRKIVDYVDNGRQGELPAGTTESDIRIVEDARRISSNSCTEILAVVPQYASAKQLAKEFLKFMYSDDGMLIYTNALKYRPPLEFDTEPEIDTSDWTEFAASFYNIQLNSDFIYKRMSHPIYYNSSYTELFYENPERKFTTTGSDREDVTAFLNREFTALRRNWPVYLSAAGLS